MYVRELDVLISEGRTLCGLFFKLPSFAFIICVFYNFFYNPSLFRAPSLGNISTIVSTPMWFFLFNFEDLALCSP